MVSIKLPVDISVDIPELPSGLGIDEGNCSEWIVKIKLTRGAFSRFTEAVAQRKAIEDNKESRMKALFGSWIESGDEGKQLEELYKSRLIPSSSSQEADDAKKFNELKSRWEDETAILSSDTEIVMHPDYQEIIGMGKAAIPLILSEMKKNPSHWFWALKSITGVDTILPDQRGRVKEMTEVWLDWGRRQGYINE